MIAQRVIAAATASLSQMFFGGILTIVFIIAVVVAVVLLFVLATKVDNETRRRRVERIKEALELQGYQRINSGATDIDYVRRELTYRVGLFAIKFPLRQVKDPHSGKKEWRMFIIHPNGERRILPPHVFREMRESCKASTTSAIEAVGWKQLSFSSDVPRNEES